MTKLAVHRTTQYLRYPWHAPLKAGHAGEQSTADCKTAIGHYYTHLQRLPTCVQVHHTRRTEMEALLDELEMSAVPLLTSGGTLATELWLGAPDSFDLSKLKEKTCVLT